ncbi:DUF6236 family protein [Desulfuromonas sp. TF]|uniref:DUF6236 family protein n=1 Tax=Desulfuromonas sp. TF TaxID=1232410 RepID=UPI0003FC1924|nr:DUF6236 family protein [Desulfuromonas sp. TF]
MKEFALYYPYIEFNSPSRLKYLALFYDKIFRIVPPHFFPVDHPEIMELLDSGDIGISIDPTDYSTEAGDKFLCKLENWDASVLQDAMTDVEELERIHYSKADDRIRSLFRDLGCSEDDTWIHVPKNLASTYMLYLSNEIAKKNNLGLATDDMDAWTAINYYESDGAFTHDPWEIFHQEDEDSSAIVLASLMIDNIVPLNISELEPNKIIKFRERRRDEIKSFRSTINSLSNELKNYENLDIKLEKVKLAIEDVRRSADEFRKSADILSVSGWFGVQSLGLPVPFLISQMLGLDSIRQQIVLATGLCMHSIYTMYKSKQELKELSVRSGYSALYWMERDLTPSRLERLGERKFRSLHEFMDD